MPEPQARGAGAWGWTLPLARDGRLDIRRPLVMGILNATPDSFSDGGLLATPEGLRAAVRDMLAAGADILDVGGESTRPGHVPVPAAEELRRVIPVIAAIRAQSRSIPVSIDTSKADVARDALAAGASFVNDVSGLRDPDLAGIVRETGCAIVLMRHESLRGDPADACRVELEGLVKKARAAGLADGQLILDPGLGFGDPPGGDVEANLALLRGVPSYGMGYPVVIGASRKRFIGTMTGVARPADRVAGSVAAAAQAVRAGAAIVRVHDVAETVQALRGLGH